MTQTAISNQESLQTRTAFNQYYLALYKAVMDGVRLDEAPLSFTERIHKEIQHYLKNEYQRPQPPLHEV